MTSMETSPGRSGIARRLKWLAWNPLWVLIALAWVALIVWAMRSRFAEAELERRQQVERALPAAPPR